MFNLFNRAKKLKTNGYYIGNMRGRNKEYNVDFNLYYFFAFNDHGIAAFIETEDAPYELSTLEFNDFKGRTDFDLFDIYTKYDLDGNNISMKFYSSNNPMSEKNNGINYKEYHKWEGSIDGNVMILSFSKSYYNYSIQDYALEYYFRDLEFKFYRPI